MQAVRLWPSDAHGIGKRQAHGGNPVGRRLAHVGDSHPPSGVQHTRRHTMIPAEGIASAEHLLVRVLAWANIGKMEKSEK